MEKEQLDLFNKGKQKAIDYYFKKLSANVLNGIKKNLFNNRSLNYHRLYSDAWLVLQVKLIEGEVYFISENAIKSYLIKTGTFKGKNILRSKDYEINNEFAVELNDNILNLIKLTSRVSDIQRKSDVEKSQDSLVGFLIDQFQEVFLTLPLHHKDHILLHYGLDYSHEEIAKYFSFKNADSSKSQLYKLRKKIASDISAKKDEIKNVVESEYSDLNISPKDIIAILNFIFKIFEENNKNADLSDYVNRVRQELCDALLEGKLSLEQIDKIKVGDIIKGLVQNVLLASINEIEEDKKYESLREELFLKSKKYLDLDEELEFGEV